MRVELFFLLTQNGMPWRHGRWVHLSVEQLDALHDMEMTICKSRMLLFNLIQSIALRLVV
jgi:Family of unknown function (DUF6868)